MTSEIGARNERATAIEDLLRAMDDLVIRYGALPEADRSARCSADAERITGELARHLHTARQRIAAAGPVVAPSSCVAHRPFGGWHLV